MRLCRKDPQYLDLVIKKSNNNDNSQTMEDIIRFKIDGKQCTAKPGQYIVEAAADNGIYIPTLCNIPGVKPKGSCRICTVMVKGRPMTACTTPVSDGMEIENDNEEINNIRKAIVEMLFSQGNHFCPSCEKSGNCMLQALAYKYQMMVPRFPYAFPVKDVDASHPKIIKDQNRCILCKRCIRTIKDEQGRSVFAFQKRGQKLAVVVDPELASELTDELAQKAMDICPVGSIILKEKGFDVPIGKRTYDNEPIGSDIENK
jgi:[NiFe] hydrogenase diaphorase moiety small subunit